MPTMTRAFAILVVAFCLWGIGPLMRWLYPGPLSLWDVTPVAQRAPKFIEPPRGPIPYPTGVFVTARCDRTSFFLGENPVVQLTVANRGIMPFWVFEGGDYRGGTRSWRFKIVVRDEQGRALPDPMPEQRMMGGMGGYHFLRPGQSHVYSALLSRYAMVDRPGTYEVEVCHDLGSKTILRPGRMSPAVRFSITFDAPTPEQAREIAARAGGLKWPQSASRSEEMGENAKLRFPVYLPFIEEALRHGEADAVLAFGHMRGTVATERLAAWAGDADTSEAIRSGALLMLAARAPLVRSNWRSVHVVIAPAILREGAWSEEARRAALPVARERVDKGFALEGETVSAAAVLLGALGEVGDGERLLALWRELMAKHRQSAGKGVGAAWGPSGYSLAVALEELRGRGWAPPALGEDEGDAHLWISFAWSEKHRGAVSAEVRSVLSTLREHRDARVRSQAVELLQSPASTM